MFCAQQYMLSKPRSAAWYALLRAAAVSQAFHKLIHFLLGMGSVGLGQNRAFLGWRKRTVAQQGRFVPGKGHGKAYRQLGIIHRVTFLSQKTETAGKAVSVSMGQNEEKIRGGTEGNVRLQLLHKANEEFHGFSHGFHPDTLVVAVDGGAFLGA